jgi:Sap, sulfolipid-1-addressing protein
VDDVIGQILPIAVGVAISPVPIIAVILMLLAPRARASSFGFLTGWLAGIVVATSVFVLLAGVLEPSEDGPSAVVGWIKLVLGLLLLAAAVKQFRGRPQDGEQPALPKWMTAVDSMTPGRAVALGALLSGVNPKNLGLCLAAGATIGAAEISTGGTVVSVAVFTLLAASTVAVPVLAFAVAADRMAKPLDSLRGWLVRENAVIMAVLLAVLGVSLLGNGISAIA